MNRFWSLSGAVCLAIALLQSFAPLAASAAERRPNVIVIVGDDMGYADLGIQGGKDIPTPHLDGLANSGVRFTSGYVSGPYCSPTRAGLLTGRYQQRFGHEFNPGPPAEAGADVGLPLTEQTMAQQFRQAGYRTGLVGKWHLGGGEKYHPLNRGFDEFFGFLGGAHPYVPNDRAAARGNPILRGREVVEEQEYLTDAFAREALAFIEKHENQPFFLYLAFNAVHAPLQALEKYESRFERIHDPRRRTYAAMMSALDDSVGRLRTKLAEKKLDEDTLIFFFSDNGGPPANASHNGALRGQKATTWEGGIRVPFFVSWKGHIPAGKTYDHPVIQLDVFPTALAAAKIPAPPAAFDGVNLLPHLNGTNSAPPHAALYWRFGAQTAIRSGDWKLVRGNGADSPLLINLATDLGETTDRSATEPEKRRELEAAWNAWNKELVEPRWKPARAAGKGAAAKGKRQPTDR